MVTVLDKDISKSTKTLALSNVINTLATPEKSSERTLWKWLTLPWGSWERHRWISESWMGAWWVRDSWHNRHRGEPVQREKQDPMCSTSEGSEEICQLLVSISQYKVCPLFPSQFFPQRHKDLSPPTHHISLWERTHFGSWGNRVSSMKKEKKGDVWANFNLISSLQTKDWRLLKVDLYN